MIAHPKCATATIATTMIAGAVATTTTGRGIATVIAIGTETETETEIVTVTGIATIMTAAFATTARVTATMTEVGDEVGTMNLATCAAGEAPMTVPMICDAGADAMMSPVTTVGDAAATGTIATTTWMTIAPKTAAQKRTTVKVAGAEEVADAAAAAMVFPTAHEPVRVAGGPGATLDRPGPLCKLCISL